jgi:glutaredoxin
MKELTLYTAEWCNPCKAVKQFLDSTELECKITIVDIDTEPELTSKAGVRGIPTLVGDGEMIVTSERVIKHLGDTYGK